MLNPVFYHSTLLAVVLAMVMPLSAGACPAPKPKPPQQAAEAPLLLAQDDMVDLADTPEESDESMVDAADTPEESDEQMVDEADTPQEAVEAPAKKVVAQPQEPEEEDPLGGYTPYIQPSDVEQTDY